MTEAGKISQAKQAEFQKMAEQVQHSSIKEEDFFGEVFSSDQLTEMGISKSKLQQAVKDYGINTEDGISPDEFKTILEKEGFVSSDGKFSDAEMKVVLNALGLSDEVSSTLNVTENSWMLYNGKINIGKIIGKNDSDLVDKEKVDENAKKANMSQELYEDTINNIDEMIEANGDELDDIENQIAGLGNADIKDGDPQIKAQIEDILAEANEILDSNKNIPEEDLKEWRTIFDIGNKENFDEQTLKEFQYNFGMLEEAAKNY